jgi:hypothetical protein
VRIALCNLGSETPAVVDGWDTLNKECARSRDVASNVSTYALIIDTQVPLSADLSGYDLLYLSAKGAFKQDAGQTQALRTALDGHAALFVEAFDGPAEKSCLAMFEKLEISLEPVEAQHPLLTAPYLFNAPPEGALGNQVKLGGRVIFSTAGYSLAWGGTLAAGHASRADIRSAHEWGLNLLHYSLQPQGV